MKRMTLQVEMDDNEVFQEAVEEALRARAKQIARETFDTVMREEIERLVSHKLKAFQEVNFGLLGNQVVKEIARQTKNDIVIDETKVNHVIEEQVAAFLEKKFRTQYSFVQEPEDPLEHFLGRYVERSLVSILKKRTDE